MRIIIDTDGSMPTITSEPAAAAAAGMRASSASAGTMPADHAVQDGGAAPDALLAGLGAEASTEPSAGGQGLVSPSGGQGQASSPFRAGSTDGGAAPAWVRDAQL